MVCLCLYINDKVFISISESIMHVIFCIIGILLSLILTFVLICLHESLYVYYRRSL
jgi:hypothetical protein